MGKRTVNVLPRFMDLVSLPGISIAVVDKEAGVVKSDGLRQRENRPACN